MAQVGQVLDGVGRGCEECQAGLQAKLIKTTAWYDVRKN